MAGIVEKYRSLNDAARRIGLAGLQPGNTEIWYCRDATLVEVFRHFGQDEESYSSALRNGNLQDTHVLLGKIAEISLERIYMLMQGEIWSPNGEARDLLQQKGLSHTSLSVGDVVRMHGKVHICISRGWI